jgi:hypothetical protein
MYDPLRARDCDSAPRATPCQRERSTLFARVLVVFALLKSANNYSARGGMPVEVLSRVKNRGQSDISAADAARRGWGMRGGMCTLKGTFENLICQR